MAIGTGTVKLSDIKNEFGSSTGPNNLRAFLKCAGTITTNTFNSGSGSITAPAGATRVRIKLWGGGGEGGDSVWSAGAGEGFPGSSGGGGGYVEKVLSVTGGVTQYNYSVGAGGTGGGNNGANGGDTTVDDGGSLLLVAGGGSGGDGASLGQEGLPVAGGTTNGAGDINVNGGDGTAASSGGNAPDGGAGALPNSGSPAAGTAPGGGGGAGLALSAVQVYGGTAGAAGRVQFIWYAAAVPEHENNVNIPSSGTLKIGDFRSVGDNVVDKDFESDNYNGAKDQRFSFRPVDDPSIFEIASGAASVNALRTLFLPNIAIAGIIPDIEGNIIEIGRTINALGEKSTIVGILDYGFDYAGNPPESGALILSGDQRATTWDLPWVSAAVTVNNITTTLYRLESLIPNGSYNATYNVTSWVWNVSIFGFPNAPGSTYNFKARVSII